MYPHIVDRATGRTFHRDDAPPATIEDAADLYRASPDYVNDVVDALMFVDYDQLPADLWAALCAWFETTPRFADVVNDVDTEVWERAR